jgi:hypothetical protein
VNAFFVLGTCCVSRVLVGVYVVDLFDFVAKAESKVCFW